MPPDRSARVPSPLQAASLSADDRWTAWQTKGRAHDRAVRGRLAVALPIAVIAAVAVLYVLGLR